MRRPYRQAAALALLGLLAPAAAPAQVALRDAFREADAAAFANRAARGVAEAQRAQALAPLRAILPSARLEAGYARTTDPIGAFGTTLRQRAVTPAAFDPARLNQPDAVGNYAGGVVLEVPVANADAWAARHAAASGAEAAEAGAAWTRVATHTDVVRAFYGAVLAAERATTLETAARAAAAHVAQAQTLVSNGVATKSDALLASVRAGDVEAQLAEARGAVVTARRQLALTLGRNGAGADPTVPAALPPSARIRAVVAADTAEAPIPDSPRADVQAAARGLDAARADRVRARAAYLPRVNSFARYDWNSPDLPYGGTRNWTVGVMASIPLLGSAGELADLRATAAREQSARALAEAAAARARLEVEQTRIALTVALQRLDIAERAAAQSAEARRIVERKYAGGLATVVELLDAQSVETGSAVAQSAARYGAIVAAAERRQALGGDPETLAALDDPTPAVAAATSGAPQPTPTLPARTPEPPRR
jgi:outer membrane protein TolC